MRRKFRQLSWSVPLLTYVAIADAHLRAAEQGGFAAGARHPLSGLDHVVAMVTVGLWGAQLGKPAIWLLPLTFPIVMAIGGFVGLIGVPLPGVEVGIAASAILLGAMVLFAVRPPLWLAAMLVASFAVFHGYAHGAELPTGGNELLYSLGFVVATGFLHGCGVLIGLIHRWPWGQLALQIAGATVASMGAVFLWQALA
jgi:urease accessory protein